MKRIRPTIRFSALLLLALTLHSLALSLVLPRLELASLKEQAQAACTASLTATDSEEQEDLGDCKPPKHSFIDYSTFFSPDILLPSYNPNVSKLLFYSPFEVMPAVYLEINVPPDSLA